MSTTSLAPYLDDLRGFFGTFVAPTTRDELVSELEVALAGLPLDTRRVFREAHRLLWSRLSVLPGDEAVALIEDAGVSVDDAARILDLPPAYVRELADRVLQEDEHAVAGALPPVAPPVPPVAAPPVAHGAERRPSPLPRDEPAARGLPEPWVIAVAALLLVLVAGGLVRVAAGPRDGVDCADPPVRLTAAWLSEAAGASAVPVFTTDLPVALAFSFVRIAPDPIVLEATWSLRGEVLYTAVVGLPPTPADQHEVRMSRPFQRPGGPYTVALGFAGCTLTNAAFRVAG